MSGELDTWSSAEFGGWLRLKGTVEPGTGADASTGASTDGEPSVKVLIYLALKA